METTEKIVEAYCRYAKGWFTIPNIKCEGQYEIDLLALEAPSRETVRRYHIESGVSISGGHSKLTAEEFSLERLKVRVEKPKQRRTVGYFVERKFGPLQVRERLKEYGFEQGNYERIIVSWGWTEEAKAAADAEDIRLWDFRKILDEVADTCRDRRTYFTDDTLRTIQLYERARTHQSRAR